MTKEDYYVIAKVEIRARRSKIVNIAESKNPGWEASRELIRRIRDTINTNGVLKIYDFIHVYQIPIFP